VIDWAAFSWEAFATLATGLAAVGAAIIVGYRQIGLTSRQLDVLSEQAKLGEAASLRDHSLKIQTLQLELLERRMSVVDEIRRIWGQWTRDGRLNSEDWSALRTTFHQAQLLYPRNISEDIGIALDNLHLQEHYQNRANQYHGRGKSEQADDYLERSFAADDRVKEVMQGLLGKVISASRIVD
jgi:hypothetical protein